MGGSEHYRSKVGCKDIFNFKNLFLDKGCGHKLTHTNKNEISINLFPVCYIKVFLLFCSAQDQLKVIHPNVLCSQLS